MKTYGVLTTDEIECHEGWYRLGCERCQGIRSRAIDQAKELEGIKIETELTQQRLLKAIWNRNRKRMWAPGLARRRVEQGSMR